MSNARKESDPVGPHPARKVQAGRGTAKKETKTRLWEREKRQPKRSLRELWRGGPLTLNMAQWNKGGKKPQNADSPDVLERRRKREKTLSTNPPASQIQER